MLVFWHQKLAMLATPKTGTTAIEAALESMAHLAIQRPPQLKHASVRKYHRFIGPWLESASGTPFTVIATMREPLDWLGSWYRYRQREDIGEDRKSTANMSFDTFVRLYCSDDPPAAVAVGSQANFLAPKLEKGVEKGLDRIFLYERIEDLIAFLEDRLNCEILLPRLNVSPLAPLDLEPATAQRLRQHAVKDFDLYARLQDANG